MVELMFLEESHAFSVSSRTRELTRAAALAHAAKVSHEERRQRKRHKIDKIFVPSIHVAAGGRHEDLTAESPRETLSKSSNVRSWLEVVIDDSQPVSSQRQRDVGSSRSPYQPNSIPRDNLGLRDDPFDCVQGSRAMNVSMHLDYLVKNLAPNSSVMYKVFNVTNVYTLYSFAVLACDSFLQAGAANIQAAIDRSRYPGDPPIRTTLERLGDAMIRVRREIKEISIESSNGLASVNDKILAAILFLATCAKAMGDDIGHDLHKRSIAAIVEAKGGIERLVEHDGQVRYGLLQWDTFWALQSGRTIFPTSRPPYKPVYPRIPISQPILQKINKLPTGFRSLARTGKLALDVIEVLARTSAAQEEYHMETPLDDHSYGFRRIPAKFGDFWEACTCFGAPDESVAVNSLNGDSVNVLMPNLQKLMILTVILYCSKFIASTRTVTVFSGASRAKLTTDVPRILAVPRDHFHSRAVLEGHDKIPGTNIRAEEGVLLWISLVLADSWLTKDESLLPHGMKILELTRSYYVDLSSGDIRVILNAFFSTEVFLERWQRLWLASF